MPKKPIRLRAALAVALSAALFVPLAVFAGSGFARGSASAAQYQYGQNRVTICHRGQTISVAQPAVEAHLGHGDTLGRC